MQTSHLPIARALSGVALLFAINAMLFTLLPLSLVCGLGESSYSRRPDLASLIWAFLLIYPCIIVLPVIRAVRLWLFLGNTEGYELNGTGLVIASAQLVHLRYWGRLLMIANLVYFPFLLLGIFK